MDRPHGNPHTRKIFDLTPAQKKYVDACVRNQNYAILVRQLPDNFIAFRTMYTVSNFVLTPDGNVITGKQYVALKGGRK